MFRQALHFIKYNNLTVLIIAAFFIAGTGVFAQTDAGQAVIGQKETTITGVDNSLLLNVDLENIDMDFKIERIEKDSQYYYVVYTFLDIAKKNGAWQYQMREKVRKVSLDLKQDLGNYLAEELFEEREARVAELKRQKAKALEDGEQQRVEVQSYSGLIGKTLDFAGRAFPGYQPVKERVIPSPEANRLTSLNQIDSNGVETTDTATADSLTDIYNQYIEENDPDRDDVFGTLDNCPEIYNPEQEDTDEDGLGDACDSEEKSEAANATSTPDITSDGGNTSTATSATSTGTATSDSPTATTTNDGGATDETDSGIDPEPGSSGTESNTAEQEVEIINLPEEDIATPTDSAASS